MDRAIARLATAQGGVVDRSQLLALGVGRRAIEHRLEIGRLHAVYRGVYAVGHGALSERGRAFAALRAGGPGAVVSHRAAAALYGMLPGLCEPLELTRGDDRRRSRDGLVIHRAALDIQREVHELEGLPVTTPARTLADLAATRPAAEVERAWAEAQVRRLLATHELAAAVRPGRRGAALLRTLAVAGPEPTRSDLERAMMRALRSAGLALPRANARIRPYLVDFLWPDQRLVVETDGWAAHGHRAAFERDRARDVELQARGYAVLRFTWRQVMREPARVTASIAQVLALRAPANVPLARA